MTVIKIVGKVALAGTLLVGAGACGGSDNSATWPSDVKENFMTGCVTTSEMSMSSVEANNYCSCILDELESELSATEFEEAEQKLLRGEESGVDLEAFALRCV